MKQALLTLLTLICALGVRGQEAVDTQAVRQAVEAMMAEYPQARLLDIYKSQFQDRYGPGHLIASADAARDYLMREMAQTKEYLGPDYELTGWEGRFVRVNLRLVADSIIPVGTLMGALLQSAEQVVPPSIEEWTEEWHAIVDVLREMGLDTSIPDFDADSEAIEGRLAQGVYEGHHSTVYEQVYRPHYRIIARGIFEQRLLPLIEDLE